MVVLINCLTIYQKQKACSVGLEKKKGKTKLGTRREIKNLNSFRFIKQAIDYEVNWQIETLEDGGKIDQATILFNPETGETRAMRSKEEANDYRYFPDPDLLPLEVTDAMIDKIKSTMPELPATIAERFEKELGLSSYDALELTSSREVPNLFAEGKGVVAEGFLKDKNYFSATKILAKHDENYMPPEVKEALGEK